MDSIGVFNEVEINGNPTFVFTTSQQIHSPDSSGGCDLPLQPLFLCPLTRFALVERRKENIERFRNDDTFVPVYDSPHFPDSRGQLDLVESLPSESGRNEPICKLPVIPLYWCNNDEPSKEIICICGNSNVGTDYYFCLECDLPIYHKECVESPLVIKHPFHPRHSLQLFMAPHGCNCDSYFVHTRCALRGDVWDGQELEGVPEEPDVVAEPFETIADGVILHFTHGHHMRLEMSLIYDHTRVCQACVLPIYEGGFYACMDQCDFILHDACANAPRRIHNALHPHPLTLKAVVTNGQFHCKACWQRGCGFAYECQVDEDCFKLDVTCASVSEPFHYQGHEHLLFLAMDPEEKPKCHVCKSEPKGHVLNCIECDFVLCFMCATLPYKVRYKHDRHYLTFRHWGEASDSDWCEICEGKLIIGTKDLLYDGQYANEGTTWFDEMLSADGRQYANEGTTGFYECSECCTTLHIHCLLGKHRYMKPGQTITVKRTMIDEFLIFKRNCHILHNNSNPRPTCRQCQRRCPFNTVYKVGTLTYCCLDCATLDVYV
ncbi:unnamed protein product [Thlaspi arvense]|uniref:Cysteine/Histidine-rich C1 domain family protein n=1 Tax=Thlaspi arvense TaxID=13288 RepID=A0AAU9SQ34_THLAR|nr:unnamed protein product [Thlaspi arvense]